MHPLSVGVSLIALGGAHVLGGMGSTHGQELIFPTVISFALTRKYSNEVEN